jgi:hypothetical protein
VWAGALLSVAALVVALATPAASVTSSGPGIVAKDAFAQCTTDAGGYCAFSHGIGVVPDSVGLTPRIARDGKVYVMSTVAGTFTTTQVTVRAVLLNGSPYANTAITFWYRVAGVPVTATTPPPSITVDVTTTTAVPPPTTTTVPVTTTTAPVPVGRCASTDAAFCTPANVGVLPGQVYGTTVNGDYHATQAGQVLDGWHITGNLVPQAQGVTVRNSWIEGSVNNDNYQGVSSFSVTDSTIGPNTGCIGQPGLWSDDFTAKRVLVQHHDNGFQQAAAGSNVTVTNSVALICANPPTDGSGNVVPNNSGACANACPDGSHSDGFQAYCPGSSLTGSGSCGSVLFDHDTLVILDLDHTTASFYAGAGHCTSGGVDPCNGWPVGLTLQNSLLIGGAFSLYFQWDRGPHYEVHGNTIARNYSGSVVVPKSPYWDFGPVSAEGSCASINWSGNALADVDASFQTSNPAPLSCG